MRRVSLVASVVLCFAFAWGLSVFAPREKPMATASVAPAIPFQRTAGGDSSSDFNEGKEWATTNCGWNMEERRKQCEAARQNAVHLLLDDAKQLVSRRNYPAAKRVVAQTLTVSPDEPRALAIQCFIDWLLLVDGYVPISRVPQPPAGPQLGQWP